MQNNVTDLSQKLQRSLDNNYNVIDMPAVVEIISTLEKTTVTKELLETTRLGKYINELRRKTTNESLAKRAKDLVKKWRDLILPEANGQRADSPGLKSRKRPIKEKDESVKRLNGQSRTEYDFSDNSNCSIKDLKKTDVIFINSDSNSSMPEQSNDSFKSNSQSEEATQPKKRGRKKGSKNHKNLIVAAEESFSNKMSAISRNSKVKTTQELLADLQNRSAKPDIELRAAQLTESLSRIDQKLNPQKKINQNVQPIKNDKIVRNDVKTVINSVKTEPDALDSKLSRIKLEADQGGSRTSTPDVVLVQSDDEIVDVVGSEPEIPGPEPLTIEGILSQLPPIERSALEELDDFPVCNCPLPPCAQTDNITVQIVGEENKKEPYSIFCSSPEPGTPPAETSATVNSVICDDELDESVLNCPARLHMYDVYKLDDVTDSSVDRLKNELVESVNGNLGLRTESNEAPLSENGLFVDIVPTLSSLRRECESYNKYSISIGPPCDAGSGALDREFREWHETLDIESYNGEPLRILPYVIID